MPSGSDGEESELTAGGTGTGSGIRQKHKKGDYSPVHMVKSQQHTATNWVQLDSPVH